MSEGKNGHNGTMGLLIKIFAPIIASAIVGFGASYLTMTSELGDMKRRLTYVENATDPAAKALFAYNSARLDKTEKGLEDLRNAINDLKNNILPQLAEIRTAVLHIKEDVSKKHEPDGAKGPGR